MMNSVVMRARRGVASITWPALAVLVTFVPFIGAFSTTNIFYVRDLGLYFWPRHLWLRQTLGEGDWPFWDPHVAAGQAAVADALNQFFLLPVTLVRVLAPAVPAFNFWVAGPFPILVIGTWLWLRRRCSAAAAAVGAAIVSLAGPVVSSGDFPNLSWTIALIPWIHWCVDRLCDAPSARRFGVLALCVGLQAVAGEPVTFSVTCAIVGAYAAAALPADGWRERGMRLLLISAAVLTAAMLASVQLVPLFDAASRSPRTSSTDSMFWSLHPLALIETVVPHVFGHVYHASVETLPWVKSLNAEREPFFYSLYVGIGAATLALLCGRDPAQRAWRRFWVVVLGASLAAALGEHTFVYPAAERVVPILKSFRFPIKYFVFTVFALGALAADGADALIAHGRGGRAMKRPIGAFVFLGAIASAAALLGIGSMLSPATASTFWEAVGRFAMVSNPAKAAAWLRGADAAWVRLAAIAAMAAFMLATVWRRQRGAILAAWAICGAAVADPLSVNLDLHPTILASHLGPPEWVSVTEADPDARVYVGGRLATTTGRRKELPDLVDSPTRFQPPVEWTIQEAIIVYSTRFAPTPSAWGVREMISYDLPQLWPREYMMLLREFRDASPSDRLRFLGRTGHRYCFLPQPPFPGAQPLSAPSIAKPMALYECHDPASRVYITQKGIVEPDLRRQMRLLFDQHHDPRVAALLDRDPPPPEGNVGVSAGPPTARIVRERNTELVVEASIPATGGYLNVIDSYDPFWTVEVDGRKATLLRASGLFRAVHLSPGPHQVRFVYRPVPLYIGLVATSVVGALLLLAGFVPRGQRVCASDRLAARHRTPEPATDVIAPDGEAVTLDPETA